MYLYDDWRIVFAIRPVTTLGGRTVRGRVERRVWMAHGEVKHKEYRMPLCRLSTGCIEPSQPWPRTCGVQEALKVDAACPQHGTPPRPGYVRRMELACTCGVAMPEGARRIAKLRGALWAIETNMDDADELRQMAHAALEEDDARR